MEPSHKAGTNTISILIIQIPIISKPVQYQITSTEYVMKALHSRRTTEYLNVTEST